MVNKHLFLLMIEKGRDKKTYLNKSDDLIFCFCVASQIFSNIALIKHTITMSVEQTYLSRDLQAFCLVWLCDNVRNSDDSIKTRLKSSIMGNCLIRKKIVLYT